MGPFPHDAPKATISPKNPAGTDGFEFVEFAHSDPDVLRDFFSKNVIYVVRASQSERY